HYYYAADLTIPVRQSSIHSKAIRPTLLKHAYSTLKSLQKWLKITNEILKTQTFKIEWNKFIVKIQPIAQEMQISLLEHGDPLTKVQINASLIKQLYHAFTVKT
ncbi:16791_t:CDS:1, partial [Funneliformis geosporum]